MLKRKVYNLLTEWKSRKHKCLLIKGQRQVGKTFIVREFAKNNYKNFVEVNLHDDTNVHLAFDEQLDVDSIISRLSVILNRTDIVPGDTLLFFDEIQDCPRARSSLKNFTLDGRYDVIASGSLLGIENSRLYKKKYLKMGRAPPLMPVGYEEHITMYGLDFEEFLWAVGMDAEMTGKIKKHIAEKDPFGDAIQKALMSRFKDFMIVGGMPECVAKFIVRKNPMDAVSAMEGIVNTLVGDINRYNEPKEAAKTMACFNSIKYQLADTNKKFVLSRIDDANDKTGYATMGKYRENLLWILFSGVGNFCYSVTQPVKPLTGFVNSDVFKVYLSDTGLLTYMYGNPARLAIIENNRSYNQGALTENVTAECLMKNGIPPLYYRKTNGKGQMELDFLMELGCDLTVIEVKSGKSRNAASLTKVTDFFDVDRRILLEDSDIHVTEDGIEHYPLFCAAFIGEMMDPEYRAYLEGGKSWSEQDDMSLFDDL